MNRSQLLRSLAQTQDVPQSTMDRIVRALFAEIRATLCRKEKVTISGFGTFRPRFKDASTRRNPRTGERIHTLPKWVVAFKAGTGLTIVDP